MISGLASAAVWGPGMMMAGNATRSDVRSFALPSLPESALMGVMFGKHEYGLTSGGLVGYSTLFTGYRPGAGNLRALSVGRLALQGIQATARGAYRLGVHMGMDTAGRAAQNLLPWTFAEEIGLGGIAGARSGPETANLQMKAARAMNEQMRLEAGLHSLNNRPTPFRGSGVPLHTKKAHRSASQRRANNASLRRSAAVRARQLTHQESKLSGSPKSMGRTLRTHRRNVANGLRKGTTYRAIAQEKLGQLGLLSDQTVGAPARGGLYKFLMGVLGGKGYTPAGELDTTMTALSNRFGTIFAPIANAGSGGAVWTGPAGQLWGGVAKVSGWATAAMIAGDWLIDQMGAAYGSALTTGMRLRERLGSQQGMSPAYFNLAATTERQRAVAELNRNVLNPRTQLMGNEAYMYHT